VILNSKLSSLSDEDFLSQTDAALKHLEIGGHLFFSADFKSQDSSKENKMNIQI
jgi:hypothetical protein